VQTFLKKTGLYCTKQNEAILKSKINGCA